MTKEPRPRIIAIFQEQPDTDRPNGRLTAQLLKRLGRAYNIRCIQIREARPTETLTCYCEPETKTVK